jgi:hypothetical protein
VAEFQGWRGELKGFDARSAPEVYLLRNSIIQQFNRSMQEAPRSVQIQRYGSTKLGRNGCPVNPSARKIRPSTKKARSGMLPIGATMENLGVWTLVALGVVSTLVLLVVYRRKISRKEIQVEALTSTTESDGMPAETQPSLGPKDENRSSPEVDSLSEQVRSYEIALASLQCELEALRAENSWLKRESLADQSTSRDLIMPMAGSDSSPALEPWPERLTGYRRNWAPLNGRLILPAVAVFLLFVAVISGYYARGKTSAVAMRQSDTQGQANLRISGPQAVGNSVTKPANAKSDPESSTNGTAETAAAKNRKAAPAGTFYKVVRHARVHSQPNAGSRPLAELKPGMEIKVVAVRGEWLEVRSLYGRPSGFIRKETAVSKAVG